MNTRVFFPTRTRSLDTSSAYEHGTPVILMDFPPPPYNTEECVAEIDKALDQREFDPMYDIIAIAGPVIYSTLVVAVAARRGPLRTLLWDAPGQRYVERMVDLAETRCAS